jgi:hypothetical protein
MTSASGVGSSNSVEGVKLPAEGARVGRGGQSNGVARLHRERNESKLKWLNQAKTPP